MTTTGIERQKLAAAQRVCPDLSVIYVILLAQVAGADARASALELMKTDLESMKGRKVDGVPSAGWVG